MSLKPIADIALRCGRAVADQRDVLDALESSRRAWVIEEALEIAWGLSDVQFDDPDECLRLAKFGCVR